jgi:methyl-accepting chemotaxis protein
LEAEVRAKESLGRMLEAERFEAAMRQHELASILADANAARERAELERDAARQEADTLRRQVRGMNDSAWVYEPIPAYMEQGAYFVIATTARLRFVAWIEGGAFVTRTGDGTLHRFDNVLCWIALPDLHNTAVAKREKYTELAEARQEIANLQRRAEHAAQELDDALDAVEAGTKERDEARQEADLLRRQVDAIVMLCVNDLDCGSCPVDSGICFDNPEICKKELAAWAALQAKEDGK